MKALIIAAASLGLLIPAHAQAQEVELSYGAAVNATATGGNGQYTVEGFVGAAYQGAFVNLWGATLDDGTAADMEFELSLGYGMTIGKVDATLTYTAYYLDDTYQTQDIALDLGMPVTDTVTLMTGAAYDLDADVWDLSVGGEFAITDKIALAVTFGDDGTGMYSEVGLTNSFGNGTYIALTYEDSDYEDSEVTLSVGFAF